MKLVVSHIEAQNVGKKLDLLYWRRTNMEGIILLFKYMELEGITMKTLASGVLICGRTKPLENQTFYVVSTSNTQQSSHLGITTKNK